MQWDDDGDAVPPFSNPMAERLISLVLLLESSSRGFTRREIVERVRGYSDDEAAAERMFERDKRELLSIGILLESYQSDPLNAAEVRYRILPDTAQLPAVEFSDAERQVLQAALAAWQNTPHDADAKQAKFKLEALGLRLSETSPLIELGGLVDLEPLLDALRARRAVRFDYRKRNAAEPEQRRLRPWGVAFRSGRQFLYGHDLDRDAVRVFNLARVTSRITEFGGEGSFEIPDNVDLEPLLRPVEAADTEFKVELRIAAGKGLYWRRLAGVATDLELPATTVQVDLTSPFTMIPQLAGDAPGVVVVAPAEIRNRVARLVRGEHGAA